MKNFKNLILLIVSLLPFIALSQESNPEKDKTSYYEERAAEDAKYEQNFKAETKKEEKKFWKDQKEYEKDLKRRDREAYEAYMQGKTDA